MYIISLLAREMLLLRTGIQILQFFYRFQLAELRMDFDIKEFRLAEMKRTINPKTASLSTLDAMNKLAEEVKIQGTHY